MGYQLNNLLKKQQHYAEAGLGNIWRAIRDLKRLLGETADSIDVNASLSLRAIGQILGSILIDDPSNTLQGLSVADVSARLTAVGALGHLQPPTPVSRPVSLRAAIAAAVSQLTLLPQPVPQR